MKKSTMTLFIIAVLLVLVGANGCSTYNKFVTQEQSLDQTWAEVETQYQRRFDLIPNLVATVKGYAEHESTTLENVTKARAGLTDAYNGAKALEGKGNGATPENMQAYSDAQSQLGRAFNIYVNAVTEAYPDLKANEQFLDLQTQLEGTENRIATARRTYTEAVRDFNIRIKRFPSSVWASVFGFEPRPQFAAEEGAEKAPKVQF